MWRIANSAVCPSMLHNAVLKSSMVLPWPHSVFRHVTNNSECLIAQAASTGEGVHASVVLIQIARYRERVDVRCFTGAPSRTLTSSTHLRLKTLRCFDPPPLCSGISFFLSVPLRQLLGFSVLSQAARRPPLPRRPWVLEVKGIWHQVVLLPPLLLLRVQWQDARPNPDVARAVSHGCTLEDDDDSSKQTLTMMISRSRTGTRCHINCTVEE